MGLLFKYCFVIAIINTILNILKSIQQTLANQSLILKK
ncbi:MAG: hypothetical protein ACI9SG_002958 [Maribacter sp.]